jgi:hypothetical protein
MATQMRLAKLPAWTRDYRFHTARKWELDFAWPKLMVYLSVEGGMGAQMRHRGIRTLYKPIKDVYGRTHKVKVGTVDSLAEDLEKHTEAAMLGWLGVRVTGSQIISGQALQQIKRAIDLRQVEPF